MSVVQWLTQQYWTADSHSIGNEENGEQRYLEFSKPVPGAEEDNFSTMLSTQEYTDIMDLSYYKGSPKTLCEDGVLMEITEYVEKYMPDYVEELERHPELEAFVRETDENGDKHYYALYAFGEAADPWEGFLYRRDWLVEYATPSEYVWDWDSEEVKNNGHPAVTPLSAAVAAGNLIGWKKNEVTEFSSRADSSDPTATYQ